jgi:cobalamin-dependent methionine synthase I
VGISNVSNAVPHVNRPLINRVYCAMLMGAGLQMMIADPFDTEMKRVIQVLETGQAETLVDRLYLAIYDHIAAMNQPTIDDVDMSDPAQAAIWKTVEILQNKIIYADAYLQQEAFA